MSLHLKEHQPKRSSNQIYRRSAQWSRQKERIGLVSSNVLRDAPGRFDLRLSWSPPRRLRPGILEQLLGTPYGISATSDNSWLIGGGILEYRVTGTDTPYLLFSSPDYTREPLDFLEAAKLPHLPTLAAVKLYLERNGKLRSPRRVEEAGFESQKFDMASGIFITLYSTVRSQVDPYLAGLMISFPTKNGVPANAADFLPVLRDLDVPTPGEVLAAIFFANLLNGSAPIERGTDTFAVYNNFALALSRVHDGNSMTETGLAIWRRIESPRSWCEHLRPDLERCSGLQQ